MPIPTPFYPCTAALCESHEWRDWSGYLAAGTYEHAHDREYYAIRSGAALIDISPLFKYEIRGAAAEALVNRIVTRDVRVCDTGQVMYSPWCDDEGHVVDDGTIQRLGPDHFRITSADPSLRWFQDCGYGMDASVEDITTELAAVALQGPRSQAILKSVVTGTKFDSLKYFRLTEGRILDIPVTITRTGYTGDLGYEIWLDPRFAVRLWEILMETGRGYGIVPTGLAALDIARIEAGLLLIDVDYISAQKARINAQKSSPFDLGLGWTVSLDKDYFIGQHALQRRHATNSDWEFVGFEVDWDSLERLFGEVGLPALVAGRASRSAVPVYRNGLQIGQATSSTFSPLLKKFIAIGTVQRKHSQQGLPVDFEITVEYRRRQARAVVVRPPFFNPTRKTA